MFLSRANDVHPLRAWCPIRTPGAEAPGPGSASSRKGVTTIRTLRDATMSGDPAATLRARPRGARRRPGRDEDDETHGDRRKNQPTGIRKKSRRVPSPVIGEQDREGHDHQRNDHAGLPGPLAAEPRLRGTGRPTANESEYRNRKEDRDARDDVQGGPK